MANIPPSNTLTIIAIVEFKLCYLCIFGRSLGFNW